MILIFSSIIHIKLLGNASYRANFKTSFHFTMYKFVEAVLVLRRRLLKFYNVIFIYQLYFEMLTRFVLHVIGASAWETLHERI